MSQRLSPDGHELPSLTYVGGPTVLLEWHGLRLLTDPTFDPGGTVYELPAYTLRKIQDPAVGVDEIGAVDAVLLSHDHHLDNLDHAGRELVATVARVLTTADGAARLGSHATGLSPGDTVDLAASDGVTLRITATAGRHGPADGDRGPVIGFALTALAASSTTARTQDAVYFSGDTVLFDGVREALDAFRPAVALLCVCAARVAAVGGARLTMDAIEAVGVARALPSAVIVPVHYEGWEHFTESRADVQRAFDAAGLSDRLRWPDAPS